MLDTSVAIALRDGDVDIFARLRARASSAVLSMITLTELQAGLLGAEGAVRRMRLNRLLETIPVIPFALADAETYGAILQKSGFSRRKVLDRMIAAQAITAQATLVTQNPADFRDIEGLTVEGW